MARRSAMVSEPMTDAPAQRAICMRRRPIGPCPTTSTVCPLPTPAFRTAFKQVLTGSTNTASSGRTPSGMGMVPRSTIQSMAFTYSAMPPPDGSNPAVVPFFL